MKNKIFATLLALTLALDNARVLELGQVGGNAGLGDAQMLLDRGNVAGLLHKPFHDAQALGVGQGFQLFGKLLDSCVAHDEVLLLFV